MHAFLNTGSNFWATQQMSVCVCLNLKNISLISLKSCLIDPATKSDDLSWSPGPMW